MKDRCRLRAHDSAVDTESAWAPHARVAEQLTGRFAVAQQPVNGNDGANRYTTLTGVTPGWCCRTANMPRGMMRWNRRSLAPDPRSLGCLIEF